MISVNNLTFKYDKLLFDNTNFTIDNKKITFIIGKNGSGKTTLANILSGLNFNYDGEIIIDNNKLSKKLKIRELRKLVGMIFQNPDHQIVMNNVYDELNFTINNLTGNKDNKDKIEEVLKIVDLSSFINSNTYILSGGEKQRLNIASILSINPKYIIFDEATSMLDDTNRLKIYNLVNELKKKDLGIIFITNNMEELFYADDILIIDNKKIIKYSKEELLNNLDLLKKYGFNIPINLLTMKKLIDKKIKINNYNDLIKGIDKL
ncbi:MAG: ABC transporter ATP-binding protein [Bacilli bacterium]|nr:ABC transporter ATP-binding protein [Bacilli bacterium]